MSIQGRPQVSIFWDESARPTAASNGYDIVKMIRDFASQLGVIKSLCFYGDISGDGPTGRLSPSLASELQCSGVTLIDTVSNGRRGGPSKMLMADLFLHVMDHEIGGFGPSTAVLITGDPDLGYGVSLLRARGNTVILICPTYTEPALLGIASPGCLGEMFEPQEDALNFLLVRANYQAQDCVLSTARGATHLNDTGNHSGEVQETLNALATSSHASKGIQSLQFPDAATLQSSEGYSASDRTSKMNLTSPSGVGHSLLSSEAEQAYISPQGYPSPLSTPSLATNPLDNSEPPIEDQTRVVAHITSQKSSGAQTAIKRDAISLPAITPIALHDLSVASSDPLPLVQSGAPAPLPIQSASIVSPALNLTASVSAPALAIPEVRDTDFSVLIAYLRDRAASKLLVYQRGLLIGELSARKLDLFPNGSQPECIRTYVRNALDRGILRTVKSADYVELSPAFRSARGSVPSEYEVLVEYLRERKVLGGSPKVDRPDLQRELLKKQPDVFIKAKTAQFNRPIKKYVRRAADLQIIHIDTFGRVSLHPNYACD